MRYVFQNPDPFYSLASHEVANHKYSGLHIDWEPVHGVTNNDAGDYARFLCNFASTLKSSVNKQAMLTVAIALWSPLWDWNALATTKVDRFNVMSTYTGNFTAFTNFLNLAQKTFPAQKFGIGLETINPNTKQPYSKQEVMFHFNSRFFIVM
jgi:hypothetical protein